MKYLQLYFFPLLSAGYGIYLLYFMPRTGGYFGDIAGMIMLVVSGGAIVISSMLLLLSKRFILPDKAVFRILLGLLGLLLTYVLLSIYAQTR